MHARRIILELLQRKCPTMHAKRQQCVAKLVEAARVGGLGLLKMSRGLDKGTALRHRIKCCDRLLSNRHLNDERTQVYAAINAGVLAGLRCIGVIIDWSDLLADGSAHLLRAAVVVKGRAFVLYEEVHSGKDYASPAVHRQFLQTLRDILPSGCKCVLITDAGFRASWFKLASEFSYEWVGRIRNRDMVSPCGSSEWKGCKTLYGRATSRPQNLGAFMYARANPIACRLITVKKQPQGRHRLTAFGTRARHAQSLKCRSAQIEPWLLAASPGLASLKAKEVVALYSGRMQIEQTFRDLKNGQWGLGLSESQTRKHHRLAILLLLGALITYVLWLIGLAAARTGYQIRYGSKKKAATTLSVISLARHWLNEPHRSTPSKGLLTEALKFLRSMVTEIQI